MIHVTTRGKFNMTILTGRGNVKINMVVFGAKTRLLPVVDLRFDKSFEALSTSIILISMLFGFVTYPTVATP